MQDETATVEIGSARLMASGDCCHRADEQASDGRPGGGRLALALYGFAVIRSPETLVAYGFYPLHHPRNAVTRAFVRQVVKRTLSLIDSCLSIRNREVGC